ncbi:enediyne antibiotic chromoprotein [Amycolatopsis sp. VC5-11]|uniref:enediyne antibiotic chromoprotein n=1 Tax=Amycolatopsis sp. VC5-11 TaxID=3120156 RepID=UPI0030099159
MISRRNSRVLAVAMSATALALGLSSAAFAATDTATVTATPSSGLHDGSVVTVTASGFAAKENILLAQCAHPSEHEVVCNSPESKLVATDGSGTATSTLTVRSVFPGTTPDGKEWGSVDCALISGGCYIGGGNEALTTYAQAPISFG